MTKKNMDIGLSILNIMCTCYFLYYMYQIHFNGAYIRNPLCWLCCSVMWVVTGYLIKDWFDGRKKHVNK